MRYTPLLRITLRLNAIFSSATGAALGIWTEPLAALVAVPAPVLACVGGLLGVYGIVLATLSWARHVSASWAVAATVLDLAWVIASVIFVGVRDVPAAGPVVGTAGIVLGFALLQIEGMRRAVFTGGRGHFERERDVRASADRAWFVVSDVARYAEFAATLHRSEIVSGQGLGLVRRCEDKNGVCWLETCVRWQPGTAYAFEVDTSAPGYPLPVRTMRGDFEVDRLADDRSTIRIRFTFEPRGGAATEWLLSLMFLAIGARVVGTILRRWAERIEQEEAKATLSDALPMLR